MTRWWLEILLFHPYRLIFFADGLKPPTTLPKFNMEPENDGFQKESPFPGVDFQVPC